MRNEIALGSVTVRNGIASGSVTVRNGIASGSVTVRNGIASGSVTMVKKALKCLLSCETSHWSSDSGDSREKRTRASCPRLSLGAKIMYDLDQGHVHHYVFPAVLAVARRNERVL